MTFFKRITALLLSACIVSGIGCFSAFAEDDTEEYPITSEDEDYEDEDDFQDYDTEAMNDGDAAAGNASDDIKKVTVPAKKINIVGSQTVNLKIGSSYRINYKLSPKNSDDYVVFKAYGKSVVKVDQDGLVTAVGYGEAKIKLKTSTGKKKYIDVIVKPDDSGSDPDTDIGFDPELDPWFTYEEITYIELLDKSAMLRVGKQAQIEPVLYPLGTTGELTYTSRDPYIASVSSSGVVTARSDGTTVINVAAENGIYAEFTVTVYSDILRGIDVSKWQGDINWKKVSMSGIDFVMIRSSYGNMHVDEKLNANVAGCEKYGIPYGFYHYSYADSVSDARKEARFFLKTIKKYSPEYPIVLDIENDHFKKMSRKQVTNIITAFMTELENAGYYASVYSYANFFRDCVDMSKIKQYDIWIASWGDEDKLNSVYDGQYGMWQYSATGTVNGIKGNVDLDYAFKDYPGKIRKNGLNRLNG